MKRQISLLVLSVICLLVGACDGTLVPTDHTQLSARSACYAGSPLDALPPLAKPERERWRHWETGAFVVTQGPPYHMVHDVIANPGQDYTVVGKFDYGGVFHKDLEGEDVHVYLYGTGLSSWEYLGKYRTNYDGKIYVAVPAKEVGEYVLKMIVAGDLTETQGYLTVVEPGRKTVLFDIDATLTINDFEAVGDYLNVSTARAFAYAPEVVNLYRSDGYQVIFLTARPYWVAKDTREWYVRKGFPVATLTHFALSNAESLAALNYKKAYLKLLVETVGLDLMRAYGNAQTDIDAYQAAGIPLEEIFIIGSNAGTGGTQPIVTDYTDHYAWLVDSLACSGQ